MHPFTVTIKNYRCFEDSQPLKIDVRPGFTAFVGPNNSGKSSCLKFFYELRQLLAGLANRNLLSALATGQLSATNYAGVEDPLELFFNQNTRPVAIDIDFPPSITNRISRISISIDRAEPTRFRADLYCGDRPTKLEGDLAIAPEGSPRKIAVDLTPITDFSEAIRNTLYVGAFRNAINEGSGTYYDLPIGTSFISTWDQLKTGESRSMNELAQAISNELARIFGYQRLEINAANAQKTMQIVIEANHTGYESSEPG